MVKVKILKLRVQILIFKTVETQKCGGGGFPAIFPSILSLNFPKLCPHKLWILALDFFKSYYGSFFLRGQILSGLSKMQPQVSFILYIYMNIRLKQSSGSKN